MENIFSLVPLISIFGILVAAATLVAAILSGPETPKEDEASRSAK